MTRRFFFGLSLCALLLGQTPAFAQDAIEPREDFSVAEVVSILSQTVEEDIDLGNRTVQTLKMRIVSGADEGTEFILESGALDGQVNRVLEVGETMVVEKITKADGSTEYLAKEKYRLPALAWLFGVFLLLAFVLGGVTSVMSVAGLLVSIGILVLFVMPRIMAGDNPLLISLLGCGLIACTSLYLAHGFSRRTSVALLSTLVTLSIATVLALAFVYFGKLFGMGSEEAMFLQLGQFQGIDLRGLLLGGILIGCLGVLDDITTAQTAAVDEISKANPSLSSAQLRKAGFSVGKEHIASLINTLALAYVGASLPLLLLFHAQTDFPLWVTLNSEFLAEEIVRTLVGSATLLFAVPISTYFASIFLKSAPGSRPTSASHGHSHHHHHA